MRTPDYLAYRYPRTTEEAFGCDAHSACAVSHHKFRRVLLVRWLLRATVIAWCALFLLGLLT